MLASALKLAAVAASIAAAITTTISHSHTTAPNSRNRKDREERDSQEEGEGRVRTAPAGVTAAAPSCRAEKREVQAEEGEGGEGRAVAAAVWSVHELLSELHEEEAVVRRSVASLLLSGPSSSSPIPFVAAVVDEPSRRRSGLRPHLPTCAPSHPPPRSLWLIAHQAKTKPPPTDSTRQHSTTPPPLRRQHPNPSIQPSTAAPPSLPLSLPPKSIWSTSHRFSVELLTLLIEGEKYNFKVSQLLSVTYVVSESREKLSLPYISKSLGENAWASCFHQASIGTHDTHSSPLTGRCKGSDNSNIAGTYNLSRLVPDDTEVLAECKLHPHVIPMKKILVLSLIEYILWLVCIKKFIYFVGEDTITLLSV
ncbi:uncharacterized protein DS421_17g599350 [Arachis hypogaea]|nr:uncharacterized protein DS421_17g599350 [Arachis hypogaea]